MTKQEDAFVLKKIFLKKIRTEKVKHMHVHKKKKKKKKEMMMMKKMMITMMMMKIMMKDRHLASHRW
jgi:hypothetical protein